MSFQCKRQEISNIDDIIPLAVLCNTKDYIVINKPHDVRMDGSGSCTIEKALAKCFIGTQFKWVIKLLVFFINVYFCWLYCRFTS